MRYYAGNWATSQWLFRKGSGAEEKLDTEIIKAGADRRRAARRALRPRDWPSTAQQGPRLPLDALARAGAERLLPHAVDDVEAYDVREGELISNVVNGWNFGDGHFHDAPAARGGPGALRLRGRASVRVIDARVRAGRPHVQRQRYRIYDAADRPGRGGLGRRRRHGRAPALARRVLRLPGRGRRGRPASAAQPRRQPRRLSDGDRRRLRPQRAGLRGGAGAARASR